MMPQVTVWIYDTEDGAVPIKCNTWKDGRYLVLENKEHKFKAKIRDSDIVNAFSDLWGDEGHG